jgi:Tfp pilus assembly protein PilW
MTIIQLFVANLIGAAVILAAIIVVANRRQR